jgi:hypothetical protein
MSQIPTENEDNRSVANSDFVQFYQPDEVPYQQEAQQQHGQPQNTGSAHNYDNELKEHKWMIANLEVFGPGKSSIYLAKGKGVIYQPKNIA